MAEGPDAKRVIRDLAQQAAQERGKLAVAYHSDMRKSAPDAQLVVVTHQWGDVKEGMIRVDAVGPKVRDEVLARQKDIAAGKLHPFRAVADVKDNEGKVVIAKGQTLSDEAILNMNWLAEGVLAKLPRSSCDRFG